MTHSQTLVLSIVLALLASLAALVATSLLTPAHAMPMAPQVTSQPFVSQSTGKPLVLIRFNQRKVYFDKPLFTAVSRALSIKPNVMFSLVSYVPVTGDPHGDERKIAKASGHLREVTKSLIGMGVKPQQIHASTEFTGGIAHDEVHVFVR